MIKTYENEYVNINFIDVSTQVKDLLNTITLRKFYTYTTFYRLFIPRLFPQYDKALYLDSDIVVLNDISKLYNIDIKDNYLGATSDESVLHTKPFIDYVTKCLGFEDYTKYFNAGILIMNLKKLREEDFEGQFFDLANKYTFTVALDQDYLNVICKNKIYYFDLSWDKMPLDNVNYDENLINIIHYNLSMKPWRYDNVKYEEYFWKYAKNTPYYNKILTIKDSLTKNNSIEDQRHMEYTMDLCKQETHNPNNYYNKYIRKED